MDAAEETVARADSPGRVWWHRLRWPLLLGAFDCSMILVVVAINRAIPVVLLVAYAIGLPALFAVGGLYSTRLHLDALGRAPYIVWAITLAAMGVITLDFMVPGLAVTPAAMFGLWFDTVAALLAGRLLAAPVHRALFRLAAKRRALIVGSGLAAVLVAEKIERHPELGIEAMGFVDDGPRRSVRGRHEPLLGGLSQLCSIIDATGTEVVIFGYTHNATPEMLSVLYQMEPNVEVLMMPRFFQFVSAGMRVDDLAGMPLLRLHRRELGLAERAFKRAEDIVFAGLLALLVLPFVPFIALAIKLDSPGPILFSHERVGKRGKPFRMYKFRSMTASAECDQEALARLSDEDPRALKNRADARVTRLGSFLRKSSIDELPQLINVLNGEMSLVGPRPAVAEEVAAYDEWQKKRLTVAPGITGMWQVNGRSDVAFDERIWLDFMYIDSWSPWLDLSILLKTVSAVLSARGAY